jgi:hypothetical protein
MLASMAAVNRASCSRICGLGLDVLVVLEHAGQQQRFFMFDNRPDGLAWLPTSIAQTDSREPALAARLLRAYKLQREAACLCACSAWESAAHPCLHHVLQAAAVLMWTMACLMRWPPALMTSAAWWTAS